MTKDSQKLGLTCTHCVPVCDIGTSIVCPSTVEITTRLRSIIHYTKYALQCRSGIGPSEAEKAKLKSLSKMFTQVLDDEGVEIDDGTRIKLIGRDLGLLVAKRSHQLAILLRHNEHLCEQGITKFPLPVSIPLSRLD